ncbi:exo-alpha-sialidase [Terracidiphilus gabretensis]|uniref:exo-alpha-sialidase n=1 Tax=Terracidiphilus gabretensis TaxID=1577687 RepID=UPI00071BCD0F|nr:exo-alpha-sialidase [Terracidiphilus gabretensis]
MAAVAMLLLPAAVANFAQTQANSWKVVGPGGGGTTISPTISPHDSRLVVERCDMSGGYVTHDNGLSWHMFNLRGGMGTFAFDPIDPKVIYAGNAALWRSNDSGQSWSMIFPSPAHGTVEHQLGDHSDYALTSQDPAYPGGGVSAIVIKNGKDGQSAKAEYLYVAFEQRGQPAVIVRSADDGITWSRFASLPQRVLLLTTQGSDLVAISGSSAYRIAPDGKVTEQGGIGSEFKSASAGRFAGEVWIYAISKDDLVHLTKDAGLHWQTFTPALQQTSGSFGAIATSVQHPETAYIGFKSLRLGAGDENLFNGIAKTTDGGQTWKVVFKEATHSADNLEGTWVEQRAAQKNQNIWFDSPYSLGVAPASPDVVYATDLFRTYRTLDGGATWQEMNSRKAGDGGWISRGLDVTTSYGMQFDPFDSRHMFIDNTDIGLFASTNGGESWHGSTEGIPDAWRNTTYWLAFDPSQRGLMWGAFSGTHDLPRPKMWRQHSPKSFAGGVAVSTDGGRHWQPSNAGLPQDSVTHILLDPSSPVGSRTLYACSFGSGVYKSTDGGKHWVQKNDGIAEEEPFAWRITASQDGSLYLVVARRSEGKGQQLAGAGALYRSTDHGEHWQAVALPAGVTGPTGLEIDPRNPEHLYLTAWGEEGDETDHNGGVYVSNDRGKTWKALFTESQHVYDLTVDTRHPDTLYITGFDAAAYRSTDAGAHWTRIPGFDFKWAHRIFLDTNDPAQIYITTFGGGVWHGPVEGDSNGHEAVVSPVPVAHP